MEYLKFPLNLILCLLWAFFVFMLWRSRKDSRLVRFMLSPAASYGSIGLFLAICLYIGLTGHRHIIGTWPFALFMLVFQTVLAFVILRGWKSRSGIRWRFLFLHVGLMTAVGSAFWGAPDTQTLRMKAYVGVPNQEAYSMDGMRAWLPYEVTLQDFDVQQYDNGVPSAYKATVEVDGVVADIEVNDPYARGFGEDVYLVGYDAAMGADSPYCILEIVREPWKYLTVAGIVLLLSGALLLFIGGPDNKRS